jgi:hypothetical protein
MEGMEGQPERRIVDGEMFGAPLPGRWPGDGREDGPPLGDDDTRSDLQGPKRGRYRWRTRLRRRLPWFLIDRGVARKGSADCGDHEWYKSTEDEDRCYHCEEGVRRPSGFRLARRCRTRSGER